MRFSSGSWLASSGIALGVLCAVPTQVLAEEPIRVLILVPEEGPGLAGHVARLERRIQAGDTLLSLVHSVGRADAIVEFVGYETGTINDGEPMAAWYGRYLTIPAADQSREARRPALEIRTRSPQPFVLSIFGAEDAPGDHGASLLEDLLKKALGRVEEPPQPEAAWTCQPSEGPQNDALPQTRPAFPRPWRSSQLSAGVSLLSSIGSERWLAPGRVARRQARVASV